MVSAERLRLDEADSGGVPWRRWGPYLSERRWGTVREDYGSTAGLLPLLFRGISGEGLRPRGRGATKSAAAGQQMGAAR
jgi:hypothetical protein